MDNRKTKILLYISIWPRENNNNKRNNSNIPGTKQNLPEMKFGH